MTQQLLGKPMISYMCVFVHDYLAKFRQEKLICSPGQTNTLYKSYRVKISFKGTHVAYSYKQCGHFRCFKAW